MTPCTVAEMRGVIIAHPELGLSDRMQTSMH